MWLEGQTSPVNDGFYEIQQPNTKTITLVRWADGKWHALIPSIFYWRGLTERQFIKLGGYFSQIYDEEPEPTPVPCYSCGEKHFENDKDLLFLSGQYICPDCGEGWVMADQRTEDEDEIE